MGRLSALRMLVASHAPAGLGCCCWVRVKRQGHRHGRTVSAGGGFVTACSAAALCSLACSCSLKSPYYAILCQRYILPRKYKDSPVQVNMGDFLRDQQQYLSSTDTEYLSIEKRANYVTRLLAGLSSGEDIADEDEHAPAPDQIRGGGETDDDEDDLNDVGTRDDEELDVEVRAGEEEIAGGDEYEYKYYSDGDENSSDGVDYRPAYDEDKQLSEAMRDSYIESVESVLDHNRKNSESNDGTPSMPAGDASPASGQQACLVQNPRTCGLLNFGNNCYVSYCSCPCPFIISSTSFSQPHRSQKNTNIA